MEEQRGEQGSVGDAGGKDRAGGATGLPMAEGGSAGEPLPLEIGVEEASALLRRSGEEAEPVLLLDVREDWEAAIVEIGAGVRIPTGQLGAKWGLLPKAGRMVVYCHHGIRSLWAAQFLRGKGNERVQSLRGGVDAWAREVEPGKPRY